MPESKSEAKKPALGRASESGDPAVQYLMALAHTHRQNGDDKAAAECVAQLAELGFE